MKKENAGKFPYKRGLYPKMYSSKLWTMRQYAGFTSASATNKRFKYLLDNGVTGLSVAFDLPTQIGYDSDHMMSTGEVGRVGVPVSTLDNMSLLFDEIPLNKISTSMTINSTAAILISFYVAMAENKGIPLKVPLACIVSTPFIANHPKNNLWKNPNNPPRLVCNFAPSFSAGLRTFA